MTSVFVRLDKDTWVSPPHVAAIRMGMDNETIILLDSGDGFSVNCSISEAIDLIGTALLPPSAASSMQDGEQ